MASPNVEFFQRQKDLQDKVTKSEEERIQLEKQLRLLMQSDQNSAHLKAAKLQSYWHKLCADEKRAQQRNAMLVREFERIDSHLSSMASRTERLNLLKQQYADYVARTYPQWTWTVEQKMRGETLQTPAEQASTRDQEPSSVRRSQDWTEAEREGDSQRQLQQQQQQQQGAHMSRESSTAEVSTAGAGKTPMSQPVQNVSIQRVSVPASKTTPASNVTNMSTVRTTGQQLASSVTNVSAVRSAVQQQPQQQQQNRHQQQSSPVKQAPVAMKKIPEKATGDQMSNSDYVNISSFSKEDQQLPPGHVGQGDQGSMDPGKDNEDVSDFGSDLPLSAGDASPVKVQQPERASSRQQVFSQSRADSIRSVRSSSGSLLPELTVDGLILLLRHIEAGLGKKGGGEQLYVTPILDPEEKLDIIQRANSNVSLQGISGTTASNLVLEQMSHVVRNLSEGCLISEQILTKPHRHLTAADIERSLAGDAQDLWTVIFQHFLRLLASKVMEPREIAAVFVPCLVADRSQYQDKAFSLVVNLLEGEEADATDASSIASPRPPGSPVAMGGSGSLMENGKVPPLKFGSLVDKPFSDDESSFFDQSLPKEPAVPLNETSAYKQMLSGTLTQQRVPVMSDDTDDDDLEKVLASSLTPKGNSSARRGIMPVATPREAATDPESLSELSAPGPKSPVYVPTAVEQKPMFSSGGSSQGPRRPGLKFGSDFETDSELDTGIIGSSKKPASGDRDDFDFYDC